MTGDIGEKKLGLLDEMKASRDRSAVLKLELAVIRSNSPSALIFIFEGADDKKVYYHWIRQIAPDFRYEPFLCNGKKILLSLRAMLLRDKGNLKDRIYFFVDRDFDDLRGEAASDNIFMTDRYSIENYLVTSEVLDEILKNEFNVHGNEKRRAAIIEMFDRVFDSYLSGMQPVNRRLFHARKAKIELSEDLPKQINKLCSVTLNDAPQNFTPADHIVRLTLALPDPLPQELEEEFNAFNKRERYRGKFSLIFFNRWLEELSKDKNSEKPTYFDELGENEPKVRPHLITLDSLACKSRLPFGLDQFVRNVLPA